ncbi:MAG: hypothetical protein HC925_00820 [Coleofasciculaceae cyanobacterium SM2_3_26]|nr:hypothetical protein [Coleofasciculaceae cyanobacterium SM2_3_26]
MNVAVGAIALLSVALVVSQPLLAAPMDKAAKALQFETQYESPLMWSIALVLHGAKALARLLYQGATSLVRRYHHLESPLRKFGILVFHQQRLLFAAGVPSRFVDCLPH